MLKTLGLLILSLAHCRGKKIFIIFFSILMPAISSCQNEINHTKSYAFIPHLQDLSSSIEGKWVDENGIAYSLFHNGVFETLSTDTNEKLAKGNYVVWANHLLEIELQSLVRGTVTHIHCFLASNLISLFCSTIPDGSQFVLTKQK